MPLDDDVCILHNITEYFLAHLFVLPIPPTYYLVLLGKQIIGKLLDFFQFKGG